MILDHIDTCINKVEFCWFLFPPHFVNLVIVQLEACAHPFFDELREPNVRLPNGRPLPPLFNFKQEVSMLNF